MRLQRVSALYSNACEYICRSTSVGAICSCLEDITCALQALDRYWSERTALISTHHHRELQAAQSAVEQVSASFAWLQCSSCCEPRHSLQLQLTSWSVLYQQLLSPATCNLDAALP